MEQAVVDGTRLGSSFPLALFDLDGTEGIHEIVVMLVALVDPGSRHGRELDGAIGLLDVDEPGPLEEVALGKVGGNGDRAVAVGAPASARVESGSGMDGEKGGAPAGTEDVSGCSQHGELGPQSTQHVGVDDDIEAAGSKRQPTGRGGHHARAGGERFASGAVGSHPQP